MPEYKNKQESAMSADSEAEDAVADPRRSAEFKKMGYDAQVQALSPRQRDSDRSGGPAAQGDKMPASLQKFGAIWRVFMLAVQKRADPENEDHVDLLNEQAMDLVQATTKSHQWSDEQCGMAARACTKAIKAYFQWRRDAQKLGMSKGRLKDARRANRQLVSVRNELRAMAG